MPTALNPTPPTEPRGWRRMVWREYRRRRWLGRAHPWVAHVPDPVSAAIRSGVRDSGRLLAIAAGLNRWERRVLKAPTRLLGKTRGQKWRSPTPEKVAALAKLQAGVARQRAWAASQRTPLRRIGRVAIAGALIALRVALLPVAVLVTAYRRLVRLIRRSS